MVNNIIDTDNYLSDFSKQMEVQENFNEKINGFLSKCGTVVQVRFADTPSFQGILTKKRIAFSASGSLLRKTLLIGVYKVAEAVLNDLKEQEMRIDDISTFYGKHTWLKLNAVLGFFTIGKAVAVAAAFTARAVSFVALSIIVTCLTLIHAAILTSAAAITFPFWAIAAYEPIPVIDF